MYSELALTAIKNIQEGFRLLLALQLTAYLWPPHAVVNSGARFDYIVIGAGTAGSVVANRLTENLQINVLLIEAGGDPPLESELPGTMLFTKRNKADWNYTGEYNKYFEQCHQNPYFDMNLGKMLGGTSSSNFLNYGRGLPRDFNSWAEVAKDDTWNWSNVLEYIKKSERLEDSEILQSSDSVYHGTNGYLKVTKDHHPDVQNYLKAFSEIGNETPIDLNEKHPLGYSELLRNIADGYRQSSASAFLKPIKDRINLHVVKHTTVKKILFDINNNAVGVEAVTEEGAIKNYYALKEIIISAGVFNTPKLLMLSGIGPKDHLESLNINTVSDLPVGKNLQDHLGVTMFYKMDKINGPPIPVNYHNYPAPQLIGYTSMDKSKGKVDYLTFMALGRKQVFYQIIKHNPKSRGKVLLRSINYADPPLIYTEYMSDESDLDDIAKFVEHFSFIGNTSYFKSVEAEMIDPTGSKCYHLKSGTPEYWKCYSTCMITGMSHFSGTCAMGSVVDGKLRVKGVKRLRVADASVLPTIPGGLPGSTVVLIGEKLSAFLKET